MQTMNVIECHRCGALIESPDAPPARWTCDPCIAVEREPQGETVRLFTPAPDVMPGQLGLDAA